MSAGFSTDDETKTAEEAKTRTYTSIFGSEPEDSGGIDSLHLEALSRTVKAELSRWICLEVRQRLTKGDP